MRKFKLIKAYPNSPSLGTIWSINEIVYNPEYVSFPEFWEEIIEKDYEIMNFISKKSQKIAIKVNEIGNYSFSPWNNILSEKELLEDDRSEIYSVRRLSDDEIFTIGDKVRISKLQCDGSFIIDRFYFDCNNDKLLCNGKSSGNGHVSITKIEKVKQPLFTTEDGKEIFKGDKFWFADKYNFSEGKACDSDIRPTLKHFSTKEAAENYVVCNKPCLSFREVNDTLKRAGFNLNNNIKIALKELVKSKL